MDKNIISNIDIVSKFYIIFVFSNKIQLNDFKRRMDMDDRHKTVRTDLAVEAKEMYVKEEQEQKDIDGVMTKNYTRKGIKVTSIDITEKGEQLLNKKSGTYITIFADGVKKQDTKKQSYAAEILSKEINNLMKKNKISKGDKGLIVGLGNWNVTPDALGPMTVEKTLVTNHLFELNYETVAKGYRPVAAISPGVMGVTGMETSDIVLSVIQSFKPKFVIVIDALASRSIDRINETIQLTDTGIHPGSGVGNKRKELSIETLGIPVFAIGVPTVVDAVTIVSDTLDYLLMHIGREWEEKDQPRTALLSENMPISHENLTEQDLPSEEKRKEFLGLIGNLSEEEKRTLFAEVLSPLERNLIVTPKEVDGFMKDMAHLVAEGINSSLHSHVEIGGEGTYTR